MSVMALIDRKQATEPRESAARNIEATDKVPEAE